MAQYKGRAQTTNRKPQVYTGSNNAYVHGNTVRRLNEGTYVISEPQKQTSHTARKNREKAYHMNFAYVLFLSFAMLVAGVILMQYIGLQSDITNSIKSISRLESELNNLKLDNDETYSRITSSIDLEEVKRVAIQELGMHYAEEGQIITISGEGSDFVRQISDIPD